MGYLTKMNGKSGQNGFSTVGLSILGQAPRLIDGLENGLIQKFESITEQSWKLSKAFLYKMEAIDSKTPKQSIKNFFNAGYLDEDSYLLWVQALEDRNILSHRYDEQGYHKALGTMKTYAKFYSKLFEII